MLPQAEIASVEDRELVLTRLIDAPRDKLYRAWTEPALLTRWFAPHPWTAPRADQGLPRACPGHPRTGLVRAGLHRSSPSTGVRLRQQRSMPR